MEIIQKIRIGNIVPAIAAGAMFFGNEQIIGEYSEPTPPTPVNYEQEYFTITNEDTKQIEVTIYTRADTSILSKIAYKKTTADSWTEITRNSTTMTNTFTLNEGESAYIKGQGTAFRGAYPLPSSADSSYINADGYFSLSGNLWSLLLWDSFYGVTINPSNFYQGGGDMWGAMFQGKSNGLGANKCIDAYNLIVQPSTLTGNMAGGNYSRLFQNCPYLKRAPELWYPTIATYGYWMMFDGCSSLEDVRCYATSGINSDNSTGGDNGGWMANVPATGTFYKAAGVTWPRNGYGIPSGWTVIEV